MLNQRRCATEIQLPAQGQLNCRESLSSMLPFPQDKGSLPHVRRMQGLGAHETNPERCVRLRMRQISEGKGSFTLNHTAGTRLAETPVIRLRMQHSIESWMAGSTIFAASGSRSMVNSCAKICIVHNQGRQVTVCFSLTSSLPS